MAHPEKFGFIFIVAGIVFFAFAFDEIAELIQRDALAFGVDLAEDSGELFASHLFVLEIVRKLEKLILRELAVLIDVELLEK